MGDSRQSGEVGYKMKCFLDSIGGKEASSDHLKASN